MHGICCLRSKVEPRLFGADKAEVNIGQQLAIKQRAMLGPRGVVDPIAAAKRIEIIRTAGVFAPRQRQRVGDAVEAQRREARGGRTRG